MSSALYRRQDAIVQITGVTLTDKEGYLLKENSGTLAVNDSATAAARAVVLEGNPSDEDSSVGILGGMSGTVRLKSSGTITKYARVQQVNDGTVVTDAGTGSRVIVGVAMESAVSGDLFEVATHAPLNLS